jgi:putative transposase
VVTGKQNRISSIQEAGTVAKKIFKPEEIINKLREAEVLSSQGKSVAEICRALGVTDQTYYRWRKEYGGMGTEQAKRLKLLERENAQLRKVLADLTLDNAILKEAVRGK